MLTIDEHNHLLCTPIGVAMSWSKHPSTPSTCSLLFVATVKLPMFKEFSINAFKDYGLCKSKTFTKLEILKLNATCNVGNAPM